MTTIKYQEQVFPAVPVISIPIGTTFRGVLSHKHPDTPSINGVFCKLPNHRVFNYDTGDVTDVSTNTIHGGWLVDNYQIVHLDITVTKA